MRGRRDRIASPEECTRLLAALRPNNRALWTTAMFAGLRRGELLALRIAAALRDRLAYDRRRGQRQGPSTYMGHATIGITLDRYGHLMPGNESEAHG